MREEFYFTKDRMNVFTFVANIAFLDDGFHPGKEGRELLHCGVGLQQVLEKAGAGGVREAHRHQSHDQQGVCFVQARAAVCQLA